MIRLVFITLLITTSLWGRSTVCLNMIVKDESHVIERCLASVKPFIDYWVILDTGSTDGTQEVIRKFMADIPGELHEEPFRNFEQSRNLALDHARGKCDYLLFIDADDYLDCAAGFQLPDLTLDWYYAEMTTGGFNYVRRLLVKDGLDWRWVGVVHEVICSDKARSYATLPGVSIPYTCEGARSQDSQKFLRDIAMLEEALEENPDNRRYTFYLAQSYRDARQPLKAIELYQKRAQMGGWDQEIFWSLLEVARLKQATGHPEEEFVAAYFKAWSFRPSRAEPLCDLARYYRLKGDYGAGYTLASAGCTIPLTGDQLFVNSWSYQWGLLLELSLCAYYLERYGEAKLFGTLLLQRELPDNVRELVKRNLAFTEEKLEAIGSQSMQVRDLQSSQTGD